MTDDGLPTFPLLCVSKKRGIIARNSTDELETCGSSAITRWYQGLILVDGTGQSWQVYSAEKIANAESLGLWALWRERSIRVRLTMQRSRKYDLESLKDVVSTAIAENTEQFAGAWDEDGPPIEAMQARVTRSKSIPQIIECFQRSNLE